MRSFMKNYSISFLLFIISFLLHICAMAMAAESEQLHYPRQDTAGKVRISGVITDSRTGEQMPFATVTVSTGDTLITATTTNIDGRYSLSFVPVKGRKYVFRVMYIGYITVETNLVVTRKRDIRHWILDIRRRVEKWTVLSLQSPVLSPQFSVASSQSSVLSRQSGAGYRV